MNRVVLFLLTFLLCMPGCRRPSAEREVRTALDAVARAVDPAYAFAVDACLARQNLVAEAAESKEIPSLEADRQIASIRVKCDRTRNTFELIRRAHEEAAELIEAGKLQEAQARLDAIVEAWRSLRGDEP